jgi:hypothetical protein
MDILTTHWMARQPGQQPREIKFFVVECKSAIQQSQTSAWTQARAQTLGYLQSVSQSTQHHPNQRATALYGAVAIGNFVRIYRYDPIARDLRDVSSSARDGNYLHVGRQCSTVDRTLSAIKSSH